MGLLLKSAGLQLKTGHLFLMLFGWGLAGLLGMITWTVLTEGIYYYHLSGTLIYGLSCGVIGALVTIRQVAKARNKKTA